MISQFHPRFPKQKGFALVVTLTLMVLLSILAIGLLSLSAVELRRSGVSESSAIARTNARLALITAIGRLQTELGPDRRISAPGAQRLASGSTSGRGHWVGVYDAFPENDELRPINPTFRRWLVSGNDAENSPLTKEVAVQDGTTIADQMVRLAAPVGSSPFETQAVEAGLVPCPEGAFAWWVSDENTKARISRTVTPPADVPEASARLQSAPSANAAALFDADIGQADARLDRLVSASSSALLDPLLKDADLLHHLTTDSLGVLSNVRRGGLKRDLSLHLEKPWADRDFAPLYTSGATPGINMEELWLYHHLWTQVRYGPPAHADGSTFSPQVPYLLHPPNANGARSDIFFHYKYLTKLQGTFLFSLASEVITKSDGTKAYHLFLIFDPIVHIWNPYNIAYHIPASGFNSLKFWGMPYSLQLNVKNTLGANNRLPNLPFRNFVGSDNDYLHLRLGKSQSLTMRPGEVQVISQGLNPRIFDNRGRSTAVLEGYLGWNLSSGQKYRIPNSTANNAPPLELKAGDRLTFGLIPNNSRSGPNNEWSVTHLNHTVGDAAGSGDATRVYIGQFAVDSSGSRIRQGLGTDFYATSKPDIYPTFPLEPFPEKQVEEIIVPRGSTDGQNKWPIAVLSLGVRSELDPDFAGGEGTRFTGKPFLRMNPKNREYDLHRLQDDIVRAVPIHMGVRRINSLQDPLVDVDLQGLGYWGGDYTAFGGTSHITTLSVPLAPIHSIAAFQNSIANGFKTVGAEGPSRNFLYPSISHSIGNSFAPSAMGPSELRGRIGPNDSADHSYLANLALWDDWFFSSISPATQSAHQNINQARTEQRAAYAAFLGEGNNDPAPLNNNRFLPWIGDPAVALEKHFSADGTYVNDPSLGIAATMMIEGAFNVNSTSVPAWKAFLSSMKEQSVPVRETPATPGTATNENADGTPASGLLVANNPAIKKSDLDDVKEPAQWTGFRDLTDDQIHELAGAMVNQVRLRGPFLSIADFVNRRPGADKDLALSGALQSALDDPSVSINAPFREGGRSEPLATSQAQNFNFPEAEAGPKAPGIPGYVKQGDLLTALGPVMTVRGDTFKIRAYGEAHDRNGDVTARAWCEATLQRTPDYLDSSDEAHLPNPASPANQTFGRRFQMISFRYLHPAELD